MKGSGFQARNNCAGVCRQFREVVCGDGTVDHEAICSGATNCIAGSCPDGQRCYRGTHDRSMCVADDTCATWSESGIHGPVLESDEEQAARRAERAKTLKPTQPAAPITPAP